ncbi:MAG: Uncharacterized protein AWU57_1023 [Marinobacter sp. T13-3]|nr:MAG: Uncharacterized protein AWU57_1023 [Marinobacter sp. T13-3]
MADISGFMEPGQNDPFLEDDVMHDMDDALDEESEALANPAKQKPFSELVAELRGQPGKDLLVNAMVKHRASSLPTVRPPEDLKLASLATPARAAESDEIPWEDTQNSTNDGTDKARTDAGSSAAQPKDESDKPSKSSETGNSEDKADLAKEVDEAERKRRMVEDEAERKRSLEEEAERQRLQQQQENEKPKDGVDMFLSGAAKLGAGTMAFGGALGMAGAQGVKGAAKGVAATANVAADVYKALSEKMVSIYDSACRGVLSLAAGNGATDGKDVTEADTLYASANDEAFDAPVMDGASTSEDPITPTAITNATQEAGLNNLAEKIKAFQANHEEPVLAANRDARAAFTGTVSDNLKDVEKALKLNEVGQIPLTSRDDFTNRLKTASAEDQEKVQKAVSNIMQATQDYQKSARSFIQGDGKSAGVDMLSTETAKAEVQAFDEKAADPVKDLNEDQKKLFGMITIEGESLGEQLGNMMTGLRDMMANALGRLNILGASQDAAAANGPSVANSQRLG